LSTTSPPITLVVASLAGFISSSIDLYFSYLFEVCSSTSLRVTISASLISLWFWYSNLALAPISRIWLVERSFLLSSLLDDLCLALPFLPLLMRMLTGSSESDSYESLFFNDYLAAANFFWSKTSLTEPYFENKSFLEAYLSAKFTD